MLGLHGFPDSVGIQSRPRTGLVSRRLRRATSSAQALHLPRASRQAVCDPDGIRYGSSSRSATVDAPRRRSLLRSHPDSSADAATPLASARHSTSPRASPPRKLAFVLPAIRANRRARSRAPPGRRLACRQRGEQASPPRRISQRRRRRAPRRARHAALADAPPLVTTRRRRSQHGPKPGGQELRLLPFIRCPVPRGRAVRSLEIRLVPRRFLPLAVTPYHSSSGVPDFLVPSARHSRRPPWLVTAPINGKIPLSAGFGAASPRRRSRSIAPPPASHAVAPGSKAMTTILRNDCVVRALLNPACSSLRHGSASSQDGFPS